MAVNVLHLIGSFNQGGSERQAVQLIGRLRQEKSYRIFPACLNAAGILRADFDRFGFGDLPEFLLTSFYDVNMLRQVSRCVGYLREHDIRIIQSHDFYTNVFGMIAGAIARVPVRIAAKRETGTKSAKQAFFERRAYGLAHSVVANAEAVRAHLIKTGVAPGIITVIHNGLDLERLRVSDARTRAEISADLGLPADPGLRFVTIVANLRSEVKNHRMFLRAAKRVSERRENVRFVLAGEGELASGLKKFAAELGIGNSSCFLGRCGQLAELMSVSDVCVLTSRSEGFSNSILEYMAASKPVVATNVGGTGEAIVDGETGFLVESDDDYALANRLIELLDNPEKAKEMGKKGRMIVEAEFSPGAQTEKTLKLYETLLNVVQ